MSSNHHIGIRPFGAAMLARKRDAIGTLVAALAMPFPPIPAEVAYLAVPTAVILDDVPPAKGVPIPCAARLTRIMLEELSKRGRFVAAIQRVFFRHLFFRESLELLDVADGADG